MHKDPRNTTLLARRQKLLGPAYSLFYSNPLHLVRGKGVWLLRKLPYPDYG